MLHGHLAVRDLKGKIDICFTDKQADTVERRRLQTATEEATYAPIIHVRPCYLGTYIRPYYPGAPLSPRHLHTPPAQAHTDYFKLRVEFHDDKKMLDICGPRGSLEWTVRAH